MGLWSTQPLTEMNTRNFPGCNGLPARLKTSPPSVSRLSSKMWEPRRLTTPWASMASYRDSFTLALVVYVADCSDFAVSNACAVFYSWTLGTVDSTPTRNIDVYLRCIDRSLAMGRYPVQGFVPHIHKCGSEVWRTGGLGLDFVCCAVQEKEMC
jgi:hypothetical protein